MQRRFHALVVTLLVLLTVSGWMGASVRPFTGTARAQVVTPDPSPPSFANQRFVIGSDNISNPSGPDTVTLATAELPDPNAFPKTTVHVHNYEGFANDQRFWLTPPCQRRFPYCAGATPGRQAIRDDTDRIIAIQDTGTSLALR